MTVTICSVLNLLQHPQTLVCFLLTIILIFSLRPSAKNWPYLIRPKILPFYGTFHNTRFLRSFSFCLKSMVLKVGWSNGAPKMIEPFISLALSILAASTTHVSFGANAAPPFVVPFVIFAIILRHVTPISIMWLLAIFRHYGISHRPQAANFLWRMNEHRWFDLGPKFFNSLSLHSTSDVASSWFRHYND